MSKTTKTAAKKATAKKAESPEDTEKGFFTYYREMFEKDTKKMAQQKRFADLHDEYLAFGRFMERHPEAVSA